MSPPLSDPARQRPDFALVPADDTPPPCSAHQSGEAPQLTGMRRKFADVLYIVLMSSGWLTLNILAVAGCVVVAFAMLGGGDWAATFLQIDNLTSRYLAADPSRRAQFHHHIVQVFSTVLLALVVFRLPTFVKRIRRDLAETGEP